jgi:hypothetical protein
VLGDTQDADFPIFRNNTGKVRPAARKPNSALKIIHSLLGQDTGVITVSTTVFDLNDGSVKVHCNRCAVPCRAAAQRPCPANARNGLLRPCLAHARVSGVRGPQPQAASRRANACAAALDSNVFFCTPSHPPLSSVKKLAAA